MFTLRRISGNGIQMNHIIGNNYTLIDREINKEDFYRTFELIFGKKHVADLDEKSDDDTKNCYAFICSGGFNLPLYKTQKNFIMTDSGKTYDNISYR